MKDLNIVFNEQILLKLIKDNSELLVEIDNDYFISDIAKDIFKTYKIIIYDKLVELNNDNIILVGNEINKDINFELLEKLDKIRYRLLDFDKYLQKLKRDYAKNNLMNTTIRNITKTVLSKDDITKEKVEGIITDLKDNLQYLDVKKNIFINPLQMQQKFEIEVMGRLKNNNYSMGCGYLSKFVKLGLAPKFITTIFASSGLAKSSFALYLQNKFIIKKMPSCYFSLENDNYITYNRLLSMRRNINLDDYIDKEQGITSDLQEILNQEAKKLESINTFYFVEEPIISKMQLEKYIVDCKKRLNTDYLIVTIDLISMLSDWGSEPNEIQDSMDYLHYLARYLNVHFIIVVQANRASDNFKPTKIQDLQRLRPTVNTLKSSNAYRERSRLVIGLYRLKYYMQMYFPDDPLLEITDDILEVNILKQNAGGLHTLKYLYQPEKCKFTPFIEEENKDDKAN